MIVEVVCYSLESALAAQDAGANRIELCGGFPEGGTTPSFALIELVQRKLQIPVHVMIRPRGGDFLYSDTEFEVMMRDVEICKNLQVAGVVFGLLNPDGSLDISHCVDLIKHASPLNATLHRAFDIVIRLNRFGTVSPTLPIISISSVPIFTSRDEIPDRHEL